MGSKASKAKRPAPTKTKAVIVTRISRDAAPIIPQDTVPIPAQDIIPVPPRDTAPVPLQDAVSIIPQDIIPIIPHDIINEILDHLATDSRSLRAFALVSKAWVQPCQRHLFHIASFTPTNACKWLEIFPMQEKSPAHHVRDLCLEIGQFTRIPEVFFECIPWFTDVDRMYFPGYGGVPLGYGGFSPLWEPSLWKLPRSVTSLTIDTGAVTLVQVRDIMAQLPNLDDLVLSHFAGEGGRQLEGIGTVLKGRFGGRLVLSGACACEDIINMLLEIPSGLRFSELEIRFTREHLYSSAVRLAEACSKTLTKLSHMVSLVRKSYHFPSSGWFDADAISRSKSPRHFRAVLQLFKVPKHSRGDLWLSNKLEGGRSTTLDPHGPFNPQTRHFSTFIRHQTRLHITQQRTRRKLDPTRRQ